ncbi:hypothetical protein SeMB42_g07138 [Synchytrium endobioticum]|uniref:Uncharacterized protein n=1 Tax=Synchytrium endobioticum TaxID=286115 RepID=A0A507C9H7_9FUNG|nr:hypothetical protein SeMB42_g07138 [Synchytrium endobioticum]
MSRDQSHAVNFFPPPASSVTKAMTENLVSDEEEGQNAVQSLVRDNGHETDCSPSPIDVDLFDFHDPVQPPSATINPHVINFSSKHTRNKPRTKKASKKPLREMPTISSTTTRTVPLPHTNQVTGPSMISFLDNKFGFLHDENLATRANSINEAIIYISNHLLRPFLALLIFAIYPSKKTSSGFQLLVDPMPNKILADPMRGQWALENDPSLSRLNLAAMLRLLLNSSAHILQCYSMRQQPTDAVNATKQLTMHLLDARDMWNSIAHDSEALSLEPDHVWDYYELACAIVDLGSRLLDDAATPYLEKAKKAVRVTTRKKLCKMHTPRKYVRRGVCIAQGSQREVNISTDLEEEASGNSMNSRNNVEIDEAEEEEDIIMLWYRPGLLMGNHDTTIAQYCGTDSKAAAKTLLVGEEAISINDDDEESVIDHNQHVLRFSTTVAQGIGNNSTQSIDTPRSRESIPISSSPPDQPQDNSLFSISDATVAVARSTPDKMLELPSSHLLKVLAAEDEDSDMDGLLTDDLDENSAYRLMSDEEML